MSATSYLRGHPVYFDGTRWRFSDTGDPTVDGWAERACGHCGLHQTTEGHDGCIGTIPGAMNACCGHGQTGDAYIQFPDGSMVRGADAISMQQQHKHLFMECMEYGGL